jgi:predicted phage tail protein
MDIEKEIQGAKKGGGGGRSAQEAANTLRSAAIVRIVEVVSEGEIVGICGGGAGIYINDTPMASRDGLTDNFKRSSWTWRPGWIDQTYMKGFDNTQAETIINAPVVQGTPVIRTLTDAQADAAKITIQLPQGLTQQNTSNGDLNGTSVTFTIETKLSASGAWGAAQSFTIQGKTTAPYERQYRIDRPAGTGSWDVRVSRLTPNSTVQSLRDLTTFSRLTQIREIKVEYNNTAVVGLAVDAEAVGGQIPTRSFMIKGIIMKIPSNYNPVTRVYTGIWDGTFTTAWTDNPAWVLYDLLTHPRYGLGEFITPAQVDKFSFYDASVYNDALLPYTKDGLNGSSPRFTFNCVINQRDDAFRILQMVAGSMRATLTYFNGQISLLQDRPSDPVKLITKANVVDGMFNYRSSGLFERHTGYNITFNDKYDRYLQRVVTVDSTTTTGAIRTALLAAEAKFGYNPADIAAYGADNEQQAIRHGRWALDTELNQTEMASWKMSINGFDLMPGDIVKVYDEDYTAEMGGGRIVSVTGTTVVIDRNVILTAGSKINVLLADGVTIQERNIIQTSGTVSTFTVNTAFSQSVLVGADYIITTVAQARQFKIIALKQEDLNLVNVEAAFHDPNKYARVELNVDTVTSPFTNVARTTTSAPLNLSFRESAVNVDNTIKRSLLISWTAPATGAAAYYSIQWRVNTGTWVTISDHAPLSYELVNIQAGTYEVKVYAHTTFGNQSEPAEGSYSILTGNGGASTLNPVTTLVEYNSGGTTFNGPDLFVKWTNPTSNANVTTATLRDFEVKVLTTADVLLRQEYVQGVPPGSIGTYSYNYQKNVQDTNNVPNRSVKISVKCRDTRGDLSTATTVTFSNPAPASVGGLSVNGGYANTVVKWTAVTDPDLQGYLVWGSTTSGFTTSAATLLNDQGDNYFVHSGLTDSTTWYYKVAAYDAFGKNANGTGMNVSVQVSGSTSSGVNVNEYELNGVTWTPNSPSANRVAWSACTAIQTLGAGMGTSWAVSAGNALWTTGILYIYYVAGASVLSSTTALTTALSSTSNVIVATYRGGTNLEIGNGKAYTDGSFIIAGTVGATQVVSAGLITQSAQINNLVVTDAKIESLSGTKITAQTISADKMTAQLMQSDNVLTRGLTVRDMQGNIILSSGVPINENFLATGAGANLLYNGDFSSGLDGWPYSGSSDGIITPTATGVNLSADWQLAPVGGAGTSVFWTRQLAPVGNPASYYVFGSKAVPVLPNKNYIVSAYTGAHRAKVMVMFYEYNAAGGILGSSPGAATCINNAEYQGGKSLSGYKRVWDYKVTSATTAFVRVILLKFDTFAGQGDSYMFVGQVMFEAAGTSSTTPSPWTPAGLIDDTAVRAGKQITAGNATTYIAAAAIGSAQVGTINANQVSASSLSAITATIGTLRTAASGPRMEISDNVIKVYDASGALRVQLGNLDL